MEPNDVELLRESIADLSLRLEDRGWARIGGDEDSFSREALNNAARDARVLAVAHPLVRRGLSLRGSFVHGQGGPQITVEHENPAVADLISQWWDMRENKQTLTGPEARARLERSLSTDGNVFIACFTNPLTGAVRHRVLPFEEVTDIVTDPEDSAHVLYYQRDYVDSTGRQARALYPDLMHAPRSRPRAVGGTPVMWDAPVRHVKVNDLTGWQFGISDLVAVAPWARAYRDFLADWAKLTKSLSQFAWRSTAEGKRAAKARQALARVPANPAGDSTAGATYIHAPGETLEAIPKTGATIDADSGRPILAMISAGLDIPITMLSTDPGLTGARATASTLDDPTYRAMWARRDVWTQAYIDIAEYVIEQAVKAPRGVLKGGLEQDPWLDSDHAVIDGATPVVSVAWPDLSTDSKKDLLAAITAADSTGKLPPVVIARLLLVALGVDDIDEVMDELTDDEGNWRDPYRDAGAQLMRAVASGDDPAQALGQYRRFGDPAKAEEALT